MKQLRLLIACGGTGGHIFPATALAEHIKSAYSDSDISFAGVFNSHIEGILKKSGYKTFLIKAGGMPRGLNILIVPFFIKTAKSFFAAVEILKREDIHMVVSMGSFSGAPFVFAGKFLGLPVLVHEQNIMPGRANRLSGYFADRIAISYDKTASYFSKRMKRRIICTGNPVRKEIQGVEKEEALKFFDFDSNKFTILVTGGSQGAHAVNIAITMAAKELDKNKFQILHLTGKSDREFVAREYNSLGLKNKVFSFFDDMGKAYAVSDLIISRAGAITIAEITSLGIASILVPYPHGDAHQRENANVLQSSNAGVIIEEKYLTKERLLATIKDLSENKNKLEEMKANSKKLARPDAAQRLAKEVMELA